MHRLHGPARAAGFDIERGDRRAVSLGCWVASHAEVVGSLVAERRVHEAERVVVSRRRPHVRRAARVVASRGRISRNAGIAHVPRPNELARPGVEGADHTRRHMSLHVIGHEAPDDDPTACDDGCGRLEIEPRLDWSHALLEIDDAAPAEIRARLAGRGVERDQTRVDRWNEDPARAIRGGRPVARRVRQLVVAETAAARPGGRFDPDVVAPAHCARICIESREMPVARAGVDVVADLQRRVLLRARAVVARAKGPDVFQLSDILAIDLRER